MKNIKKTLFLSLLPILALTSCNSNTKSLTFNECTEYVADNYDVNAFDNVEATYTAKITNFDLALDLTVYSASSKTYVPVYLGVPPVSFTVESIPVVCFNSTILGYTQAMYAQFSGIAMEFVSDIATNLNYYLNDGALKAAVESTDPAKISNVIAGIFAIYHSAYVATGGSEGSLVPMIASFLPIPNAEAILTTIGELGIGVANNSTGKGTFDLGIKTNNKGYINDVYLKCSANVDLYLASNSFTKESGELPLPEYNYNLKGSFNIGFEILNNI